MPLINISSIIKCTAIRYSKESTKKISDDVFNFFRENPNPNDSEVHAFAEKNKYDVHKLEKEIYRLAGKFVSFMTNGLAAKKGITEKDVDPIQLKKGIKVELEHFKIDDNDLAQKIAIDHLAEIPNYYDLLDKMEKSVEK